jgi:hypothetical protein
MSVVSGGKGEAGPSAPAEASRGDPERGVRRLAAGLLLFALVGHLVLLVFYLHYGPVYLDAGFYLYASKLVYEGRAPYLDFFFVQPPVYPYVYGLPGLIWGNTVRTARWTSFFFALVGLGFILRAAWLRQGALGAAIAAVLIGLNAFHAYSMVVTKLYALSAFWVALFAWAAVGRPSRGRESFAAVALAVGVCTRLTLLPALVAWLVYLLWKRRARAWPALLGAVATGILINGWFILRDPVQVYYNLFGIHTSAHAGPYKHGLMNKLGVVSHLVRDHLLFFALLVWVAVLAWRGWRGRRAGAGGGIGGGGSPVGERGLDAALWAAVIGVTLAHASANWFAPSYQSIIYPLAALLVSWRVAAALNNPGFRAFRRRALVALGVAGLFTPLAYGARSTWRVEGMDALEGLDRVGAYIAEHTPPEGKILTCNAFYALAAGREVVAGFEGAPFTYCPGWERARCRKYSAVNDEMIVDLLRRRVPAALVLYEDSFAVGFPGFYPVDPAAQARLFAVIEEEYELAAEFPNIRGGPMLLRVYLPRKGQGAARGSAPGSPEERGARSGSERPAGGGAVGSSGSKGGGR